MNLVPAPVLSEAERSDRLPGIGFFTAAMKPRVGTCRFVTLAYVGFHDAAILGESLALPHLVTLGEVEGIHDTWLRSPGGVATVGNPHRSASGIKFSSGLGVMARIRNQKQGAPTKSSRQKKSTAKSKAVEDSSDEENLVTEVHETSDVSLCAYIHLDGRFSSPRFFKQPNLTADVSAFLKDLHAGPSKKKRDGKAKEDAAPRLSEKSKPKEKKTTAKGAETRKKGSKETVADAGVPLSKPTQSRSSTKIIFPPTSQWYSAIPPLPATTDLPTPTPTRVSSLLTKATSLHAVDVQNYTASGVSTGSASDSQFLQKVLQSGTLSDRLSAMTLLVQGSPVHNVRSLESLKGMAERGKGKGGREESLKALRCIVDWWVGGGAPDRKLK